MATRVFADEELQRLREFPEISREELFRYFTLTPADRGSGSRFSKSGAKDLRQIVAYYLP